MKSKRLVDELAGPLDYHDAQRFRWVTVLVASMPVLLTQISLFIFLGPIPPGPVMAIGSATVYSGTSSPALLDLSMPWLAGALLLPVPGIAFLVFVVLVSGVHTYCFHPRTIPVIRQNRAVALSYYAIGPLAWLPLPMLLASSAVGLGYAVEHVWQGTASPGIFRLWAISATFAVGSFFAIPGLIQVSLIRIRNRLTGGPLLQTLLVALLIDTMWLLSAAVAFLIFPWVVGFVWLVIDSFR